MISPEILELIQYGGPTGAVAFLAYQLGGVKTSLQRATQSIEELNIKMAVVVEKTSTHETRLEGVDNRLRVLELRGVTRPT